MPQEQAKSIGLWFDASVSQFDGIKPEPLSVSPTISQVIEYIKTDSRLKTDINECRQYLLSDIDENARDQKTGKLLLDNYDEAKKSLPGVTWSGTFKKRTNTGLLSFSGFLSFDIDFINKNDERVNYNAERDKARQAYKIISQDKYTSLIFPSVSAAGVKGLVKIPTVSNDADYKSYFRAYKIYMAQVCRQSLDSLPDIARLCFLSYCDNPYINHDSEVFTQRLQGSQPDTQQQTSTIANDDPSVRAAVAVLVRHGIKRTLSRNDFVGACAACKRAGVDYDTFDRIMKKTDGYDAKSNFKIWNTVDIESQTTTPATAATLITYAREADKELFRELRKQYLAGTHEDEQGEVGLATLIERKLRSRYQFRLNSISDKTTVTEKYETRMMSDHEESQIRCWLLDQGFGKRDAIADVIRKMAYHNQYNPIQEYLNGIVWNGESQFLKIEKFFHDNDKIFPYIFKAWCVGAVRRIFTGQHHQVIIFSGKQGKGKSFFARWLCPLKDYHLEAQVNPDTNDAKIRVSENWIWEIGEVGSTTRRADIESLKQFISLESAVFRRAHDKYDQRKPAIASFIGTVNPDGAGFLNDPTGYRRWWPVELQDIDLTYTEHLDVNQIWAEAVQLYKDNPEEECRIPDAVQEKINKNIENEFTMEDPVENLCLRALEFTGFPDDFMETTEVIVEIVKYGYKQTNPRGDSMAMGKAIKRLQEQGYMITRGRKYGTRGERGFFGIRPKASPGDKW